MKKKFIAVFCSLSLWLCTPEYTMADSCSNQATTELCMYEADNQGESEGMSLFTKILIGVLIYAILATLLYRQGGSGNDFVAGSSS